MEYLTFAVPNTPDRVRVAKQVSRALDPGSGGYNAFERTATDGVNTWAVYGTHCSGDFCASAQAFKDNPAALYAAVIGDSRWQGESMPTLSEVQDFCANVRISTAYGWDAAMADLGLTLIND